MQFHVVDINGPQSRIETYTTEPLQVVPSIHSMAWIPFSKNRDPSQLGYLIGNLPSYVLRSDALAIGFHPRTAMEIPNLEFVLDEVARRIEGGPLLLVQHNTEGNPTIAQIRGPECVGLASGATLERIVQFDVAEVVRRPGSVLPKHPGFHYEGPNGDHYEAFLRTGFSVRSTDELDRLSFWLAPKLRGRRCLLVDHSSMIAVGYHISRYIAELGGDSDIIVESLRTYDEDFDDLVNRLRGAFNSPRPSDGCVLVSVNSSGRLMCGRLIPAMKEVGFSDPIGLAIARTPGKQDHTITSLTTLADEFTRFAASDCPLCQNNNSTLVPIQPDSYLLDLATNIRFTAITREITKHSTPVIERYKGIGAFSVHRTHSNGNHYAYFINMTPILESKAFHKRLRKALRPWKNIEIDLIVHPNNENAQNLAKMIAKHLSVECVLSCDERNITALEGDCKCRLIKSKHICLVDEVLNTGSKIFGYRRAINTVRLQSEANEYEFYCIVGVNRCQSERELVGITDVLHHSNKSIRFLSVERLCLPGWNDQECRWCAEQRLWTRLPDGVQGLSFVQDRLERLNHHGGLENDLFLSWTSNQHKKWYSDILTRIRQVGLQRFWTLGPNSVFGDVQNADLAVSVAASLQTMRNEKRGPDGTWRDNSLSDVFHSPIAKVLDPEKYIMARFYDPVIIAAILRAAKRHDVRVPNPEFERKLQDRLQKLSDAPNFVELHGELMLAAAFRQLPECFDNAIALAHSEMKEAVEGIFKAN